MGPVAGAGPTGNTAGLPGAVCPRSPGGGGGTAAEQPGLAVRLAPGLPRSSSGRRGPSLTVLETAGPGRLLRRPTTGSRSPAPMPSSRETSWHTRKGLKLRDAGRIMAALSSGCQNGCPRRLSDAAGGTFRTSAGPRGGGGGTAGLRLPRKVTIWTRWPVRTRTSWDPLGGRGGEGQRTTKGRNGPGGPGRRGLTARSARSGAAAGASSC